jgi:transcriptional regulator with XRE-family HTH domain
VENISEKLRAALKAHPDSLRSIAERTGIDHTQLSRFVRGERTLRQGAIDDLAKVLGLELRPKRRRGSK